MTEGLRKFRHLPSPLDINENFKILFGGKLDPHGFSFLTSVRISTTVADYVVNEEKANPAFIARFHHTSCSDEMVFATLLHDYSAQLNLVTDNSLRFINWKKNAKGRKQKNSPLLLNEDEYLDIMESGAFFCRKVHPIVSEKLILLLENQVKNVMDRNEGAWAPMTEEEHLEITTKSKRPFCIG